MAGVLSGFCSLVLIHDKNHCQNAAKGQGVEAWRQLCLRFDPQTDASFALLLIGLASFKIGKTQDVQSGLVRWETMLLALERGHSEKLSPKIRRALLLNILPSAL